MHFCRIEKFNMKKLTTSVLAVVLMAPFAMVSAQKSTQKKVSDTAKVQDIEEVVVTALGIKREKRALGYATQEVKSDALFNGSTNTGNALDNLSGKVAGLQVNSNSNFGGATTMAIRGVKALAGANPLIVIDGAPVNNTYLYSGNMNGGFDLGSALSDISQGDIESMNILKGAAASALYGDRALNGVIVITTKNGKGRNDGSWGVTYSTSVQTGMVDKSTFPEYQTKYGAGYYDPNSIAGYWSYGTGANGSNNVNFGDDASWGAAFDPNLQVYDWESYDPTSPKFGQTSAWVAAKNGPITFFETPMSFINSISLQKGEKDFNIMLNYANENSTGLLPNSSLKKNTFSTKINYDFTPKLHASVYTTMTLQNTIGRTETGYNDNIVTGFREWWQTNVDLLALKDAYYRNIGIPSVNNNYGNVTWNRSDAGDGYPAFWNNPYFQRYQNFESDERTRNFTTTQLVYDVDNHINITGRFSIDNTNILYERRLAEGSYSQAFGVSGKDVLSGYDRTNIFRREINYDVFGSYKYDLTSWLNLSGIVGGNIVRQRYDAIESSTEGGLTIPWLYALGNSKQSVLAPLETNYTVQNNSLYATASFDFNKIFYLDGTYRNVVSSTLPINNNQYGYFSVSGSLILSQLLKTSGSVLEFWKIRGNYAEVGGTADPYQLAPSYRSAGILAGSVGIFTPITTFPNNDLKPQRTKEFEFGTEASFFNERISFDGAYYNNKTFDQIIAPTISSGTGQLAKVINAGEIDNKGVELHLGVTPVKTKDFSWNLDANWSKNNSKVVVLDGQLKVLPLVSMVGATIVAAVDEPWGAIYGTDYVYLNGQKVVDPNTGLYETEDNKVIGNAQPKWLGGVRNTFRYKDFSLSFLIDIRHGGDIYSSDLYYGLASGLYKETGVDGYRTTQAVLPGVNPNGQINTTPVSADFPASGYGNNAADSYALAPDKRFVYDGSYIKLREASITYSLPKSIIGNTFLNEAKISIIGRNLWIIHKNLPYADPESTQMGGLYSYGSSIGSLPTTREIGVNLTVKF